MTDVNEVALLQTALRTAVGLLFLQATVGKLSDRAWFEGVVANYRLLPAVLTAPVARLLPWVEVLLAAALFTGVAVGWSAPVAAALLTVFAAAMAINLGRGRTAIDCGCGRGGPRQTLSWSGVVRNLVLSGLLLLGPALPASSLAEWALGAAGGLVLFLLDYVATHLAWLAPRPAAPGTQR